MEIDFLERARDRREAAELLKNHPYDAVQCDEWEDFCFANTKVGDEIPSYSYGTPTYFEDKLLCFKRASEGELRAVEMRNEYILWKLRK